MAAYHAIPCICIPRDHLWIVVLLKCCNFWITFFFHIKQNWCVNLSFKEAKRPYWNRGPAHFHRLTPNKIFEPMSGTVITAVCSLFNRMLSSTNLILVHLLQSGRSVMIGYNHTSLEWIRAVRHIYGYTGLRHTRDTVWYVANCCSPRGTSISNGYGFRP